MSDVSSYVATTNLNLNIEKGPLVSNNLIQVGSNHVLHRRGNECNLISLVSESNEPQSHGQQTKVQVSVFVRFTVCLPASIHLTIVHFVGQNQVLE